MPYNLKFGYLCCSSQDPIRLGDKKNQVHGDDMDESVPDRAYVRMPHDHAAAVYTTKTALLLPLTHLNNNWEGLPAMRVVVYLLRGNLDFSPPEGNIPRLDDPLVDVHTAGHDSAEVEKRSGILLFASGTVEIKDMLRVRDTVWAKPYAKDGNMSSTRIPAVFHSFLHDTTTDSTLKVDLSDSPHRPFETTALVTTQVSVLRRVSHHSIWRRVLDLLRRHAPSPYFRERQRKLIHSLRHEVLANLNKAETSDALAAFLNAPVTRKELHQVRKKIEFLVAEQGHNAQQMQGIQELVSSMSTQACKVDKTLEMLSIKTDAILKHLGGSPDAFRPQPLPTQPQDQNRAWNAGGESRSAHKAVANSVGSGSFNDRQVTLSEPVVSFPPSPLSSSSFPPGYGSSDAIAAHACAVLQVPASLLPDRRSVCPDWY